MVARKEAMMKSVRSELALANAQELINVRNAILVRLTRTYSRLLLLRQENKREMLSQMHCQAGYFVVIIGTGVLNQLLGSLHGGL